MLRGQVHGARDAVRVVSYGRERQGCPLRREPGFRFLAPDSGVPMCSCINDIDIDEGLLKPGAKVSFDVEDTDRGSKATNVAVTEPGRRRRVPAPIVARIGTVVVIAAMTATTIADTTGP